MKDKIVFSTDPNYLEEEYVEERIEPADQDLRIWLEHRPGGKSVSIIRNFIGPLEELKKLEKILKKKCSVGGTTKNGTIVIQTKDRQNLLQILNGLGYYAKLSGG